MLWTSLSECPLPSMHGSWSDESGSEEDPIVESNTRRSRVSEDRVAIVKPNAAPVAGSKSSAAIRISMALSKSHGLSKSQSDAADIEPRDETSPQCFLPPTTKISMALTAQTSKFGRRLSALLHNSRLRQRSSSVGMTAHHVLLCVSLLHKWCWLIKVVNVYCSAHNE